MQKIRIIIAVVYFLGLFVFVLSGCRKSPYDCSQQEGGCPETNWDIPEALHPKIVEYLDSIETISSLNLNQIVLPNGQKVMPYLQARDAAFLADWESAPPYINDSFNINTLIARTAFIANKLINRNNFQIASEGANKPAQNGLAYVYGSKDISTRRSSHSTGDRLANCTEELKGLDCSGLVKFVLGKNRIPVRNTVAEQGADSIQFVMGSGRAVVNLGKVPLAGIQPGDIICWNIGFSEKPGFTGIVVKTEQNELALLTSTGAAYEGCERNYSSGAGINITRGPRLLRLIEESPRDFVPELPLLTRAFCFRNGKPYSSYRYADEGTFISYYVIRIVPIYYGTVNLATSSFSSGGCNFTARMSNISLGINFFDDYFYDQYGIESDLEAVYNETSSNCSGVIPANRHVYSKDFSSFYNNAIEIDFSSFSNPHNSVHFSGFLSNNAITGNLKFLRTGPTAWTINAPITLYAKY